MEQIYPTDKSYEPLLHLTVHKTNGREGSARYFPTICEVGSLFRSFWEGVRKVLTVRITPQTKSPFKLDSFLCQCLGSGTQNIIYMAEKLKKKVNMKKILWFVPLFITAIVFITYVDHRLTSRGVSWKELFGTPEYEKINTRKSIKLQKRTVEIGNRVFEIPMIYISTDLGGKRKQDGLNLIYVLPNYTPRSDFADKQTYDKAEDDRRFAHMLIQNVEGKVPLVQSIENRKKNEMLTKYDGNHYGLKKYIDYDSPKHPNIDYNDTYLELDESGDVLSFISCTAKGKAPFPGCTHSFIDNGLYYGIYYNKTNFLPSWKDQRRKAIEFINNLEIKSLEKQEE